MASVSDVLNQEQFAAFKGGDEAVLERAVRGTFASLVDQARAKLGNDASSAPRVVGIAVLQAWKARDRFDTPRALDDYLADAIERVAKDEHHRRESVHRMNENKGVSHAAPGPVTPADVDKAWSEMKARLHPAMEERAETRRAVGAAARHTTSERMQSATKRKVPYFAIGVGAVVVVAVVWWSRMANLNAPERDMTKALASTDARDVPVNRGQRGNMTLGDSTKVQLGADTHMKIPPGYNAQVRGVSVNGSAQFTDRAPAEKQLSFRVRIGESSVESKGSTFAVRAYEDEPEVFVRVKEGTVDVRPIAKESKPQPLAAGPGMAIAKDGKTRMLTPEETEQLFSWTDGTITITAMPLEKALLVLNRWFGSQVKLPVAGMGQRPVTTTVKLESSGEALDLVSASANAHVGFRGDTMVFEDGLKNAKAAGKKK